MCRFATQELAMSELADEFWPSPLGLRYRRWRTGEGLFAAFQLFIHRLPPSQAVEARVGRRIVSLMIGPRLWSRSRR